MLEYEEAFGALNSRGIRYMVAGGFAVVLHGFPRFTADLDLIVDLERHNARAAMRALESVHYRPKLPVKAEDFADPARREEWIAAKRMRVFSLINAKNPLGLIDVFVSLPFDFDRAYARKRLFRIRKGLVIPALGLDELKTLKKLAGRPQDLQDLAALDRIGRDHE